jgi:hypothetical protein
MRVEHSVLFLEDLKFHAKVKKKIVQNWKPVLKSDLLVVYKYFHFYECLTFNLSAICLKY